MEHMDLFHRTIDQLLEINKQHRMMLSSMRDAVIVEEYAHWIGTICCDAGRQVGKTEYILRNATADDAIIVSGGRFRDMMKPRLASKATILIPNDLHLKDNFERFNRIFVDEPADVFQKISRHLIYSRLAKDHEQTFIFLGSEWR